MIFCDGVEKVEKLREKWVEKPRCTWDSLVFNIYSRVFNFLSAIKRVKEGIIDISLMEVGEGGQTFLTMVYIGREMG